MTDLELSNLISNLHKAQEVNAKQEEIEALFKLAEFHYNNENFVKAKLFLKEILQIDESVANVNYYLSLIEVQNGKFDDAISLCYRELKINPKNDIAERLKDKLRVNSNFPLVTLFLFLINFVVFFVFSFPQISLIDSIKFGLSGSVLSVANVFTSLFFHINAFHFVSNMLILLLFGLILEKHIGSLKFLAVYVLSGMIGNFVEVLFSLSDGIVLGASSALFGVLGAIMMREPLLKLRVFGVFKVPIIMVLGVFFAFSSLLNVFFDSVFVAGDIAHFIGLFVGMFLIVCFYFDTMEVFYNWIFIAFGFMILEFAFESMFFSGEFLFNLMFVFMGVIFIVYSYLQLKQQLKRWEIGE